MGFGAVIGRRRNPDFVHEHNNRHGTKVYYLRRPGHAKVRLRIPDGALPWSPRIMEVYDAAVSGLPAVPSIGASRTIAGTVNAALVCYYGATAFAVLAKSTRGRRWVDRNLDQHRRVARNPGAFPKAATTSETRSAKLGWEAQLRELEFRKRSGELVDRAATERAIFERANIERDRWLGWIPRTASQLAAELDVDPTKLFGTLDRLVRDHLMQLAATPLALLRRE